MTKAIAAKGTALHRGATVSVAGSTVTWISGTQFSSVLAGAVVKIGGSDYTVASVDSPTQLTLTASAGAISSAPLTALVFWGAVAEVTAINGLNLKADTTEVTPLLSDWKEYIKTLKDAGEVALETNYVPTDATQGFSGPDGLGVDFENDLLRRYWLTFPTNPDETLKVRWMLDGHVTAYNTTAAKDGAMKSSITIKATGEPILQ